VFLFSHSSFLRFSEDFNAALLLLGVQTVEDLPAIYDDVLMLESFQAQVPKEEFDKFLQARDFTVVLLRSPPLPLPRPPTPVQRANNNTLPITPIRQQSITEQQPSTASIQDLSVDVKNSDNSVRRWETALATYSQQNETSSGSTVMNEGGGGGPSRSQGRVVLNALIDISGSMQGTKLIAVKLGLSALISQLEDKDVMNITSFSDRSQSITGGFQTIGSLKRILPVLLNALLDDGSTAFFDAVIEGIRHLRHYSHGRVVLNDNSALLVNQQVNNNNNNNIPVVVITPEENQKCIVIALTDGEDNASRYSSPQILYRLSNPGINNFMFVLLAVDMGENEERTFGSWMELRYCKQISVNIRSGSKLVQIFKEVLINRILMTEVNNARFYQFNSSNESNTVGTTANPITNIIIDDNYNNSNNPVTVAAPSAAPIIDFDRDDENLIMNYRAASAQQVFQTLRTDLLRQHNTNNNTRMRTGDEDDEDNDSGGNLSRAVSRCNSECDFNIHDDNNNNNNTINFQDMIDLDYQGSDDGNNDGALSPVLQQHNSIFGPSSPTRIALPTGRLLRRSGSESLLTDDFTNIIGRPVVIDEVANQGQFTPVPTRAAPTTGALGKMLNNDAYNLPKECYCPITVRTEITS
jgi:hypothetical protein